MGSARRGVDRHRDGRGCDAGALSPGGLGGAELRGGPPPHLARQKSRARLAISADIRAYISSESQMHSSSIDLKDASRMISVTINNVGPIAVSISYWSSFIWSVLGGKEVAMQNPAEPDFRSEPIVLLPGKSASIVLSFDLLAQAEVIRKLAATSRLGTWSLRFPK